MRVTGVKTRAAMIAAYGGALMACLPAPALAYGLDGLFGGRPNADGSVTVDVPISTEQAPDRAVSVLRRDHPDYDPLPLHLASFWVAPTVETGIAYNSNIYNTPSAVSDEVISVHPAVTAISDWSRNFLAVTAEGDLNFFQDHPNQNLDTAVFQVDGRYDFLQQTSVAGHAGYQRQNVPRATLDNAAGEQPATFNLYSAGVSAFRGAGLIQASANYGFNRFDYAQDATGAAANTGSATTAYNVFNRDENTVGGKVAYDVSADLKPYVSGAVNSRTYDMNAPRNSQGYRADVGVSWDFGGITSLDLYTGWLAQHYSSFGAEPVNQGADFGGTLLWNATPLTSLQLDLNRSIQESTITGYNSFMASGGTATLSHELRRNVILEGNASYAVDNYRGVTERQDDVETAGGGVRWLINRHLYTDLDYSWNHRSSSVESQGYVEHLVVAKLGVRF